MSDHSRSPISDVEYDIIVTMSNLLQGSKVLRTYQADAEKAGDSDCARIFGQIRDSYDRHASDLHDVLERMHGRS